MDGPTHPAAADPDRPDRLADALIRWVVTPLAGLWCAFLLATWVPTFLTWPWSNDYDHFAMMAQLWEAGGKPYRDIFSFQFPGEVYLFWGLGKAFGWGNSVAFYGFDAALVVAFGALLVAWGRTLSGSLLPGLIGFSAFLLFYVSVTALIAGQRDWHAAFPAVAGLLLPGVVPGRSGRVLSALAFGWALTVRPQVIVLLPAVLPALDASARAAGGSWRPTLRAVAAWLVVVALVMALGFVPLVWAGVLDDFLANLRTMSQSPYNSVGSAGLWRRLSPLHIPMNLPIALVMALLLWDKTSGPLRRAGWVVVVTLAGAAFYHAISPMVFPYHVIPQVVAASVGAAFVAAQVLQYGPKTRLTVVAVGLLFLFFGARERPRSFQALSTRSPTYTVPTALRLLRTGGLPTRPPLGYYSHHPWAYHRDLIEYLRAHTTPETPIANLLISHTAAVAGQVPRPSALPVDSGLLLMADIPALVPRDQKALETTDPCVVVWEPSRPTGGALLGDALLPLFDTVRQYYRFEARFGPFEVWRRKESGPRR